MIDGRKVKTREEAEMMLNYWYDKLDALNRKNKGFYTDKQEKLSNDIRALERYFTLKGLYWVEGEFDIYA